MVNAKRPETAGVRIRKYSWITIKAGLVVGKKKDGGGLSCYRDSTGILRVSVYLNSGEDHFSTIIYLL